MPIHDWLGEPMRYSGAPADAVWGRLRETFLQWTYDLQMLAAPHLSRDKDTWQPPPRYDTGPWWARMITQRLDNYSLVCSRRSEQKGRPDTVDGLPVEEEADVNEGGKDSSVSSNEDGGGARDGDGADMRSDADTDDAPPRTVYPPVPGTQCNRLPLGSDPASVSGQPARGLERTAEARYGRDYAAVAASCARVSGPVAASAVALPMEQRLACISSGTAVQIGKQV